MFAIIRTMKTRVIAHIFLVFMDCDDLPSQATSIGLVGDTLYISMYFIEQQD